MKSLRRSLLIMLLVFGVTSVQAQQTPEVEIDLADESYSQTEIRDGRLITISVSGRVLHCESYAFSVEQETSFQMLNPLLVALDGSSGFLTKPTPAPTPAAAAAGFAPGAPAGVLPAPSADLDNSIKTLVAAPPVGIAAALITGLTNTINQEINSADTELKKADTGLSKAVDAQTKAKQERDAFFSQSCASAMGASLSLAESLFPNAKTQIQLFSLADYSSTQAAIATAEQHIANARLLIDGMPASIAGQLGSDYTKELATREALATEYDEKLKAVAEAQTSLKDEVSFVDNAITESKKPFLKTVLVEEGASKVTITISSTGREELKPVANVPSTTRSFQLKINQRNRVSLTLGWGVLSDVLQMYERANKLRKVDAPASPDGDNGGDTGGDDQGDGDQGGGDGSGKSLQDAEDTEKVFEPYSTIVNSHEGKNFSHSPVLQMNVLLWDLHGVQQHLGHGFNKYFPDMSLQASTGLMYPLDNQRLSFSLGVTLEIGKIMYLSYGYVWTKDQELLLGDPDEVASLPVPQSVTDGFIGWRNRRLGFLSVTVKVPLGFQTP